MLNVYIPYKYLYPPLSTVHLCIVMAATEWSVKMRAIRRGVSVAIHILPFILPHHLSRRLTGHKHE